MSNYPHSASLASSLSTSPYGQPFPFLPLDPRWTALTPFSRSIQSRDADQPLPFQPSPAPAF